MATQHFKRNLFLNLYREEKNISLVCFLLTLQRDKNVLHLQPISSIWRPLAFLPVTLSRVFSNKSTLRMRWPNYWSFSFSINPSNEHPGLISFRIGWTGWISLQSKGFSKVFSNTTIQKHQFFGTQLSSQSNSHIHT